MNNEFCDVTLVRRDNQKFEVNKVILSAYINVFKNMLASNKHPHPMIFMRAGLMRFSRHFLTSSTAEMKVANLRAEGHEEIGLVMVLDTGVQRKRLPKK